MAGFLIVRKAAVVIIALLSMTIMAGICAAGDMSTGFADYLFKQADYYRAIGEYKRYIYEISKNKIKPNDTEQEEIDSATYKIGLCYLKAGKYDDAMAWFKEMEDRFSGYKKSLVLYNQALALNLSGDYEQSGFIIDRISALLGKEKPDKYLSYLKAWNYIYEDQWNKAEDLFAEIKDGIFAGSSADIVDSMKKNGAPDQKPMLPGIVMAAVVPGTGYFYCNRFFDGLLTLALNALFITNTALSFKSNNATGEWLWGAASVLSYSANLYGTGNAVMLYNRAEDGKYTGTLEIHKSDLFIYDF